MKINRGIFSNRHTTVMVIATIILTTVITTSLVSESFALKAKGKSIWKYGSATSDIVCGDRLCSEYANGKAGYLSSIKSPIQETKSELICAEDEILIKGTDGCTGYEISETFVTEAYVDKKLNSIIIGVNPYNGGTLVIEPSQQTITGIFMILIDGQEWRDSYIEENKVTVNFPWATEKIEIIGESVGN